jgi:hypothetical protein
MGALGKLNLATTGGKESRESAGYPGSRHHHSESFLSLVSFT